eukprot:2445656-Amphidinium_carterae.2
MVLYFITLQCGLSLTLSIEAFETSATYVAHNVGCPLDIVTLTVLTSMGVYGLKVLFPYLAKTLQSDGTNAPLAKPPFAPQGFKTY